MRQFLTTVDNVPTRIIETKYGPLKVKAIDIDQIIIDNRDKTFVIRACPIDISCNLIKKDSKWDYYSNRPWLYRAETFGMVHLPKTYYAIVHDLLPVIAEEYARSMQGHCDLELAGSIVKSNDVFFAETKYLEAQKELEKLKKKFDDALQSEIDFAIAHGMQSKLETGEGVK